jgi:membrane fusion protein, macrolide-specific efflux system
MPDTQRSGTSKGSRRAGHGARRRPNRHGLARRFLAGALVCGLVLAGAAAWRAATSKEPQAQYPSAAVQRGDVEDSIVALGSIQPREFVDVGTQVSGQLRRILVNVGDTVKAGALVAEIDSTVFAARVDAGHATLHNLAAQLEEKRATHALALSQHERNQKMFAQNAVSRDAVETSLAASRIAAAQVAGLLAQADQTRAALRVDEANLGYTRIVAPMSGTVIALPVRQGQTVNASQQAPVVVRLANLDTMTVVTQVSEADVMRLNTGMPVYFSTLGAPQRRWVARIRQILPTPETVNNVVLYSVLFDVDNKDQQLKAQMSAQVSFVVAQAKDALLVPLAALRQGEAAVQAAPSRRLLVLKEGRVESREVQLGVANRIHAQVLSGLNEGELVVVDEPGRRAKTSKRDARS